jgi:hypothetical protein
MLVLPTMHRDFEINDGIYLCQPPHKLDLHNNFDFCSLNYSIEDRVLVLHWRRSNGVWVSVGTPSFLNIEFREVSEFRFLPRDAELPFTEDDCVSTFGYWTDETWADGVIMAGSDGKPEPRWLTAIQFMSIREMRRRQTGVNISV